MQVPSECALFILVHVDSTNYVKAIQSVNTVLHFNTPCLHFSGRFLLGSSTTMYNSKPALCLLDVAQVNCTILPSDQVAKSTYEIGRDAQRASCLDCTKVVHLFFCFHALFATMWCRIRRWSESETNTQCISQDGAAQSHKISSQTLKVFFPTGHAWQSRRPDIGRKGGCLPPVLPGNPWALRSPPKVVHWLTKWLIDSEVSNSYG